MQETGWVSGQCFWPSGSVFGVIDMLRDCKAGGPAEWPALFPNLSLLVCTDMGTGPADFVAVQPGRVVFIHVKYSDRGGWSATSLHEGVVQALKNLMYLQPSFDGDMPGSWDGEWERRVQRVRYPATTVARNRSKGVLVGRVQEVLRQPNTDREIRIVVVGGSRQSTLQGGGAVEQQSGGGGVADLRVAPVGTHCVCWGGCEAEGLRRQVTEGLLVVTAPPGV